MKISYFMRTEYKDRYICIMSAKIWKNFKKKQTHRNKKVQLVFIVLIKNKARNFQRN